MLRVIIKNRAQRELVSDHIVIKSSGHYDEQEVFLSKILKKEFLEFNSKDSFDLFVMYLNKSGESIIYNLGQISNCSIIMSNESFIKLRCKVFISDDYYSYNQNVLDHMRKFWGNEEKRICKDEMNEDDSRLYLDVSLLWNGVPSSMVKKKIYFFDTLNVNNRYDLFISMGEIFQHKRGYFGSNLDAFEECLQLSTDRDEKSKFIICNSQEMQRKIGEDYYNSFIEILKLYFDLRLE